MENEQCKCGPPAPTDSLDPKWLSDPDRMEAEMEAIAAGYCPNCGKLL